MPCLPITGVREPLGQAADADGRRAHIDPPSPAAKVERHPVHVDGSCDHGSRGSSAMRQSMSASRSSIQTGL